MSCHSPFPPDWVGKKQASSSAPASGPCSAGAGAGAADVPLGTSASSPPRAAASTASAAWAQPQLHRHEEHRESHSVGYGAGSNHGDMQEASKIFPDCFGALGPADFSHSERETESGALRAAGKDWTGTFIDGNVISEREWQR